MPGKVSHLAVHGSGEGIGLARTAVGDVGPNFSVGAGQLRRGLGACFGQLLPRETTTTVIKLAEAFTNR
jgi:hypothetical protein